MEGLRERAEVGVEGCEWLKEKEEEKEEVEVEVWKAFVLLV